MIGGVQEILLVLAPNFRDDGLKDFRGFSLDDFLQIDELSSFGVEFHGFFSYNFF